MPEQLLVEIKQALEDAEVSSDGARRLNLLALSGLISEVHQLRAELSKASQSLDVRVKKIEDLVPWIKGLAFITTSAVGTLIAVFIRYLLEN